MDTEAIKPKNDQRQQTTKKQENVESYIEKTPPSEERKMKFVKALTVCRKYITLGKKLKNSNEYHKAYRSLSKFRKLLGLPGNPCDLLPRNLLDIITYVPECLFEKKTVEETIKELDWVLDSIESFTKMQKFEKMMRTTK